MAKSLILRVLHALIVRAVNSSVTMDFVMVSNSDTRVFIDQSDILYLSVNSFALIETIVTE
jgi:hypothetical protein